MIKAEIVADSANQFGNRITTFVLTFPRIVLSEFNTHRVLSRNSASSRAIPFKKMLKMVQENPFIPIRWMKEHTGMQGTEYFGEESFMENKPKNWKLFPCFDLDQDEPYTDVLKSEWLLYRDEAVESATRLHSLGVTKQLCNRLLEPFMWHTVIVTGTEWENFFALRAHPDAEIHIQDLAFKMLEAYNESTPKLLKDGEWHIPFGDTFTEPFYKDEEFNYGKVRWIPMADIDGEWVLDWLVGQKIQVATARCARVSYLNFEGKDDYEADFVLHDRLLASGHMSPFEHCARAMNEFEYFEYNQGKLIPVNDIDNDTGDEVTRLVGNGHTQGWCGNFRGFIQYRKLLTNENKTDERVIKHG